MSRHDITVTVNGVTTEQTVDARLLLVHLLRERLRLTGPKVGCDTTSCGACTILVDGRAVKSCTMFAVQADGASIRTIEGVASLDGLHPLQQAFWDEHGLQCGFCTSGMVMAALDLLAQNPEPNDDEIRTAISGNLCRCTGYANIVAAVRTASVRMAAGEA
jgi:aerobic carbon-monoxide dehydrogenase small subunit